ncbi:Retrovirus-related Pol polyprotein from transposon RE2 [Vitis vinifera]|uniref:Retrovirus-related Pol polyprotein from transposon RE2 n=1 Tax=Vitis vinifera TaxID=29760 RepID=A0A438CPX3_VITVI|nr:Retrovirus-related Pol polyprotein from transposon RE2 [Vitis vinifera]
MATKSSTISFVISGSPMITSEKLVGNENYLSWSASVEFWFMGQGYEDHLVTQEADIPEAKGLYTNDIQRLYKVASSIVNVRQQDMDLSTYIGQIASLKEEFLTVMPFTTDFLHSPSLDDVFARLLRISSTQTLSSDNTSDSSVLVLKLTLEEDAMVTEVEANVLIATYCNKLGHTRDRCYQLHGRPPCIAHVAQSSDPQSPQPPSSSTSQGISLVDNSGASDHISGNKDLFSSITTTSASPTVTLANGSQTMAKGFGFTHPLPSLPLHFVLYAPECPFNLISISKITRTLNCSITFSDKFVTLQDRTTGKTIDIGCESQGLYHLTSPSTPAVCISTDAPLLIHSRLGHPSLSKFQKMVPRFSSLSSLALTMLENIFCTIYFIYVLTWIIHQSSCAHTPQQNGVAERYSRLQKSYRCYSSETHRYFLSVDVTFFEDSPFFSTSESLPVSKVLPFPIISPPDAVPSRPLQVYHRYHRVAVPPSLAEVPANSLPIPSASPAPALLLLLTYLLLFGKSTPEALSHPGWRHAMVDEMTALHSNDTWDLVVLPSGKSTVGCRWSTQLRLALMIASVRLLLSMVAMRSWPLYQLDIKMLSFIGIMLRKFIWSNHLVLLLRGVWFSVQEFGMFHSTTDHSVFYHHNSSRQCIYLVVYVDDIVITSSDQNDIQKLKQHLFTHFQTKYLGKLKYFLRIEIAQSSSGVVLSQRKYALDILEETGMLDCKPVDTPMDSNVKLIPGQGEPLGDPRRYWRLVGKLNYLTITCPDISFPISVVSQFLQSPCDSHWDVVIRILRYIKSTPGQGVLYENRGHTQSKKQDVVARSSAETEYRAMTLATCELIWLKHLLRELRFGNDEQMKLICDNQAALHIASNPVFHERTKHIKVDCHFISEKIASGCVATSFVNSNDQLADIFTKSLRGPRIKYICNKLGAYNIYAPA